MLPKRVYCTARGAGILETVFLSRTCMTAMLHWPGQPALFECSLLKEAYAMMAPLSACQELAMVKGPCSLSHAAGTYKKPGQHGLWPRPGLRTNFFTALHESCPLCFNRRHGHGGNKVLVGRVLFKHTLFPDE